MSLLNLWILITKTFIHLSVTPTFSRLINNIQFEKIKTSEIKFILKNNKNTAPGVNKVSNKILKLLDGNHLDKICELMNSVMDNQVFPESWKIIKVIPILKPNKSPDSVQNYRPIALINTFTKLFNKLIKNRLDNHLGDQHLHKI